MSEALDLCGAMATLEDGRVLIVGGHGYGAKGLDNIFLFDPITLTSPGLGLWVLAVACVVST